jgi:hypothetical protein
MPDPSHNDRLADSRKQASKLQKLLDYHLRVIEECEKRGMGTATLQDIKELLGKEEYERLTKPVPGIRSFSATQNAPPKSPKVTAFKDVRTERMTALFKTLPGCPVISMGTHLSIYPEDGFWAIRGKSIEAYATLERSLSHLFSHLSGIPMNLIGIVFFRIIRSDTVRNVLEDLMDKKYGDTYSLFMNSFWGLLKEISDRRNQIVHWNVIHTVNDNSIMLVPPDLLEYNTDSTKTITGEDCIIFIDKCLFISRHILGFVEMNTPESSLHSDQAKLQTSRDIFLRPIVFPPPHNHPMFRSARVPENQPPPSPP